MPEVWKPVPGWEGQYEVSNLGRVRSVPRMSVKMTGAKQPVAGSILKVRLNEHGYHQVRLKTRFSYKYRFVHRLVLEAFKGPALSGQEGCHNDGDKSNNALGNLRWDTHLSNMKDYKQHRDCIAAGDVIQYCRHGRGHTVRTVDQIP